MSVRDSFRDAFPGQSGIGLLPVTVTFCSNGCEAHSATHHVSIRRHCLQPYSSSKTVSLTPSKTFFLNFKTSVAYCFSLSALDVAIYFPTMVLGCLASERHKKAFVMASAKCICAQRQKGGPDALLSALAVPDAKPDSSTSSIAALPLTKIECSVSFPNKNCGEKKGPK